MFEKHYATFYVLKHILYVADKSLDSYCLLYHRETLGVCQDMLYYTVKQYYKYHLYGKNNMALGI